MSKPNGVETFQEYAECRFVQFVQRELQSLNRVDVMWDCYLGSTIKGSPREKFLKGVRHEVSAQEKIPAH